MSSTLASALWPASRTSLLLQVLLAALGSLILAVSAQIQVPFWPVPVTMQTLAVLLIGAAYGPWLGFATVALYLIEGAAGLPVFAGLAGGPQHLVGPTGGYLMAFPIAAALVGALTGRTSGWLRSLAAFLIADALIFALGYAVLTAHIGAAGAWTFGVQPFLLGDLLKVAIAALATPTAWRLLGNENA